MYPIELMTPVTARQAPALAAAPVNGYRTHAAANSAAGRGNPTFSRRTSAPNNDGAFLVPVSYGGCAWDALERAGFLECRFSTPRTVATYLVERIFGGSEDTQGASPMAEHASASARPDITLDQIATALIGANLIRFRVNRRPDQLQYLMGLSRMAAELGVLSRDEHRKLLEDLDALLAEEVRHG